MSDAIDIKQVDLKDTSPEFQETRTDFDTILRENLEEKGIDPETRPTTLRPYDFEMIKETQEAQQEVINNKLDIISSYLDAPVSNEDMNFFGDFGMAFTLERSKSFHNRKKRF